MGFSNIVCLSDLLRNTQASPCGFFGLIREPVRQGSGLDIAYTPGEGQACNLAQGFSLKEFYQLIHGSQECPLWEPNFYIIPDTAGDYLRQHIPQGSLVLSFEMPPWLVQLCQKYGIDFLDIRPSPLRFGRDLYIAMRTNNLSLYHCISKHQVLSDELRLEASELAASVNMHQQNMEEAGRYAFNLNNTLIFIGQAPNEASLLTANKSTPLNCMDFTEHLQNLAQGRRVLHKPHPLAIEQGNIERRALENILATRVEPCFQNAYQILSCHHDVTLTGISSDMLQEAAWFDKPAHILFRPFTPLVNDDETNRDAYQQIPFETWLSPEFWHSILTPDMPAPRVPRLPSRQHHHARHLIDQWDDYAKVATWEKSFAKESFDRAGGIFLRHRVETVEQATLQNRNLVIDCDEGNNIQWPPGANIRGKIFIRGKGNSVTFAEGVDINTVVTITGDNNHMHIDEQVRLAGKIYFWGSGGSLEIGRNSTLARVEFKCHEGKNITIGKDCMFSYDIELRTTDGHSIVDSSNGQRLNMPEDIVIGDHVWVGKGATILKGVQIASNSIVGADALLNRTYLQEQSIIAGSPAKVIKQGVTWHRDARDNFSKDELNAWRQLPEAGKPASWPIGQQSGIPAEENWIQCIDDIQKKIKSHPQQFGRGNLYQGHEIWGVPGQRPTLLRINEYQLEKWLPPHAAVLDIGCNIGMFGLALSEKIDHYYGFDNNPLLIEIARQIADARNIENCQFVCESFQDFSASSPDRKFDAVLSFAVHVWIGMSIEDYAIAMYNLLQPGGILVWESNRLDTNDKEFFHNVYHFINAGFSITFSGRLKDDNIIERGFYILTKKDSSQ